MFHHPRLGIAALAIGGALLAPTAALAADNDQQPTLLQRALHDERRADLAIAWGEQHPGRVDAADDRALVWERRADAILGAVGVADPRLDAGRQELRQAEQALDTGHGFIARVDERAAEALLDGAIRQTRNDVAR